MRHTRYATACLALMTLIALAEARPTHFHPVDALDRMLASISDRTDLTKVLQSAARAAEGR